MPIPPFNGDGLLPVGQHAADAGEIKTALVDAIAGSTTRPEIFAWWQLHFAGLCHLAPVVEQWLDGSFVTNKTDPGDADTFTVFDGPQYDALPPHVKAIVTSMTLHKYTEAFWHCDAYGVGLYPDGHPMHAATTAAYSYWDDMWGHTKTHDAAGNPILDGAGNPVPKLPKGYVKVTP